MADNYLENKMEEYRKGAVRKPERRSPSGNKPHTALMPCALRGAFVIGDTALSPLLKACAMALRDTSCRTAFCCTDKAAGATTAQALGLQYYPLHDTGCLTVSAAVDKAGEAYGAIDVLVYEVSGTLYVDVSGNQSAITQAPDCPSEVFIAAASRLLVYLALPQSTDLCLGGHFVIAGDGHLSIIK